MYTQGMCVVCNTRTQVHHHHPHHFRIHPPSLNIITPPTPTLPSQPLYLSLPPPLACICLWLQATTTTMFPSHNNVNFHHDDLDVSDSKQQAPISYPLSSIHHISAALEAHVGDDEKALLQVFPIPNDNHSYNKIVCRHHNTDTINEADEQKRCSVLLSQVQSLTTGTGSNTRWVDVRFSWEHASLPIPHAHPIPSFTPSVLNHDLFEHLLAQHPDQLSVALLLDTIRNGANIAFDGQRDVIVSQPNMPSANRYSKDITDAITNDQFAGYTSVSYSQPPFLHYRCSPLGVILKQTPTKLKVRIIKNLSAPYDNSVNANINKISMEYITFDSALEAVVAAGPGTFMSKIDIKDAFRIIKVRPADWPLLVFCWLNQYMFDLALPFGLRSSPPIWDRVAIKVYWLLQHLFIFVAYWVDDFFMLSKSLCTHHSTSASSSDSSEIIPFLQQPTTTHHPPSSASCHQQSLINAKRQLNMALLLLLKLHVPTAPDKVEGPAHVLTYLGIIINTITMTVTLPADKKQRTIDLIHTIINRRASPTAVYHSLLGQLQHVCKVLPQGRPFLHRLYHSLNIVTKSGHETIFLSKQATKDLQFWLNILPTWDGISILYKYPWTNMHTLDCYTDASLWGQGGVYGDEWFSIRWTEQQKHIAQGDKRVSMPFYELYAIYTCVVIWGHRFTNKRIIIHSDCMPVVHALTSGHTSSPHMAELLRCISHHSIQHHFLLRVEHVSGVKNIYADHLSRNNVDAYLQASRSSLHYRKNPPLGVIIPNF